MGSENIFVLRHEHEIDGYDSMIILGVYSSMPLAERARRRFESEPGFRETQNGFVIHPCRIDQDLWSGGFATVRVGPPLPSAENDSDATHSITQEGNPCP